MRAPKPAQEQYDSMVSKLHLGRLLCLHQGIPEAAIVYVVRNNQEGKVEYRALGCVVGSLEEATATCAGILHANCLSAVDVYDIVVLDGRESARLLSLLEDLDADDTTQIADAINAKLLAALHV